MRKLACIALCLSACMVGDSTVVGGQDPDPPDEQDPTPQDPTPDPDPEPPAPSAKLTITATTTTKGGTFAPQNVVAVWVEDAQGTFVKTIDRWSQVRTQYLLDWNSAAGTGDVDSVSGASRLNHNTPLQITWKLKGRNQQEIPDGTYTIRMESTESNALSTAENNEGTFTFTKGPQAQKQTNLSNGGFTNVTIDFTPAP